MGATFSALSVTESGSIIDQNVKDHTASFPGLIMSQARQNEIQVDYLCLLSRISPFQHIVCSSGNNCSLYPAPKPDLPPNFCPRNQERACTSAPGIAHCHQSDSCPSPMPTLFSYTHAYSSSPASLSSFPVSERTQFYPCQCQIPMKTSSLVADSCFCLFPPEPSRQVSTENVC